MTVPIVFSLTLPMMPPITYCLPPAHRLAAFIARLMHGTALRVAAPPADLTALAGAVGTVEDVWANTALEYAPPPGPTGDESRDRIGDEPGDHLGDAGLAILLRLPGERHLWAFAPHELEELAPTEVAPCA